jgi:predicted dehydrogenase
MAVRVGLVIEPTGDHLSHYYRVGRCSGVEALAVADSSRSLAGIVRSTLNREVAAFPDTARMMRQFSPGLVVISLEPHRMPSAIAAAIEGGAHVLVEKPACSTLVDFERVAEQAEKSGRKVMLAMATRLDPSAVEARRIVERGWLGAAFYGAAMHWVADQTRLKDPAYHASWKASKKLGGGGKLIFHGVHYLDLLHYLTGDRAMNVSAFLANVGGQPIEVEDSAVVSIQLRRGAVAVLNTGYYLDKGYSNQVFLWGSAGWLRFEPRKDPSLTWFSTAAGAPRGVQRFRNQDKASLYDRMLQAAVDFVNGATPPFIDSGESAAALRTVFAAYSAAESGVAASI